ADQAGRGVAWEAGVVREVGHERLANQPVDDGGGRVERSAGAALIGGHEPLEDAAEHLGVDADVAGALDGGVRRLAGREAIALEEAVEDVLEDGIREVRVRESALEGVPLEEAAVQVGERTQRAGLGGAVLGARVEGAEEEGVEDVAKEAPRPGPAAPPLEEAGEEGGVPRQVSV